MPPKKSWTEKLNTNKSHQVKQLDFDFAGIPQGSRMLIATPKIIDDHIQQIPAGHSTDVKTLRNDLAITYHADHTCPVSTGIFLRIVAEAAYEKYINGFAINQITPFWRVIDGASKTAQKLSFGKDFIINLRKEEGLSKQ